MEPIVDAVVYVIPQSSSGYAELATLLSAIAALASVIVACVAVRFSHKQIMMYEQHNRLMATPHLSAWNRTDKNLKAYFYTLENNGLGPAIAREIKLWVDGELQEGEGPDMIEAAARKVLGESVSGFSTDMFIVGEFIPPGRKFNTFSIVLPDGDPGAVFIQARERVRMLVRYDSILGDSYIYDSDLNRKRV